MTETLVVDAPKTTVTRKRVNQRNVLTVLEKWQAGGLNFEEEVSLTLYKANGKLRLDKGGAVVTLVVPAGPLPSWRAMDHELKMCTLLKARVGRSGATVCLEYHADGSFSHGTMTVLGSAGYTGSHSTAYSQPAGRMV